MATNIMARPLNEHTEQLGTWSLHAQQTHILRSSCKCSETAIPPCNFCIYETTLNLPDRPEMTFDRNILTLTHLQTGCRIQLNTLDALKLVDDKQDVIKVAYSADWLAKRQDNTDIKNTPKPFDWTFTTAYTGTLLDSATHRLSCTATTQEPEQEKLLRRDKISYHTELVLFEDELADNGSSKLIVKCRVMPTFILVLLRFYLRVDSVLVRVRETRLYCEKDWDYILREVTLREAPYADIKHLGNVVLFDEMVINKYLAVVERRLEKIGVEEK